MKAGIIAILAKRAAGKKPDAGDSYGGPEETTPVDKEPAKPGDEDETRMAGISIAQDVREAIAAKDDGKLYDALCELIKSHAG